ncbi:hypothetical protein GGF32_009790 [Allomyces javanicus]|nr:hypothetical protein GGF32_009790 [Allomyces javanicus]
MLRRSHSESQLLVAAGRLRTPTVSSVQLWVPEANLDANGHIKPRQAGQKKPVSPKKVLVRSPPGSAGKTQQHGWMSALAEKKQEIETLQTEKAELRKQTDQLKVIILKLQSDKAEMKKELTTQAEHVAKLLHSDNVPSAEIERREELQYMMQREINANLALKARISELEERVQIMDGFAKQQTTSIKERDNVIQHQQYTIAEIKSQSEGLQEQIRTLEFQLDQVRVFNLKMEKQVKVSSTKEEEWREEVARLQKIEAQIRQENEQLREKLKEMIHATEGVNVQFLEMKKNVEAKREHFAQLSQELEEARNLYAVLMTQKKQLQSELGVMVKQRNEAIDNNRHLETTLLKKEREINDLLGKVNDTIKEYEGKLTAKEEQMWAISEKLNEEASKKEVDMSAVEREFLIEMERKIDAQARAHAEEMEDLVKTARLRENQVLELTKKLNDMETRQYEPRMERLRAIEKDFKSRMEEYLLAEESLETALICPKCLQFFQHPQTLTPCGHTFCRDCVAQMKAEHYDRVHCQECPEVTVQDVFRNEPLESLTERFTRRKSLMISMMSWIKVLKVFVPGSQVGAVR